jgi:hypothetical protein
VSDFVRMTDDEWQAYVMREAAKAIGEWLEGRGGLHRPIRDLRMSDLEAMAQNAISTFIVKSSERRANHEPESQTPSVLLI